MRTRTLVLCLLVSLLGWATPVLAHVPPEQAPAVAPPEAWDLDGQALVSAAGPARGLWTLLAVLALGAVAVARHRRSVALAAAAVLVLITFEVGLHSVHHIGEPGGGKCVVAHAPAQTGALATDRIACEHPTEPTSVLAASPGSPAIARSLAPDRGRAPPTV
jgi:hypothetical protein